MLYGIDISHYNYDMLTKTMLGQAIRQKTDFYIAKATEGKTYKDECLELWAKLMPGRLKGWYHYARPENNSPEEEAEHFIKTIGDKIGTGIMALDWEGEALHYDTDWAADWAQYVYTQTGIKPLIYVQESEVKNMGSLLDLDCGLWVAKWSDGTETPSTGKWPYYALWQYRSTPLDMDVFNGNEGQWVRYSQG